MKLLVLLILISLLADSAYASGPTTERGEEVEMVFSGNQCAVLGDNLLIKHIDEATALALGLDSETAGNDPLAVTLGLKPTPGYGIMLVSWSSDTELEIVVKLSAPSKGSMLPQMITWPCIVLTIPDSHSQPYRSVRVVTDRDVELGRVLTR